jgi:hypothetical protein
MYFNQNRYGTTVLKKVCMVASLSFLTMAVLCISFWCVVAVLLCWLVGFISVLFVSICFVVVDGGVYVCVCVCLIQQVFMLGCGRSLA